MACVENTQEPTPDGNGAVDANSSIDSVALDSSPIDSMLDAPTQTLVDPVGVWRMTLTWGNGDCGQPAGDATTIQVTVTSEGTSYKATTDIAGDETTGSITRDASSARIDLTISNPDPLNNGGQTTSSRTVKAVADTTRDVIGDGMLTVMGMYACTQPYTLSGRVQ